MGFIRNVLVVGGGVAGLTFAIAARQRGIHVVLVELNRRVEGAGLGISTNALVPLEKLGLLKEILKRGKENIYLFACDSAGKTVVDLKREQMPGLEFPVNVVISRPDLAEVLYAGALGAGVLMRSGYTVENIESNGNAVDVWFSNGTFEQFDAVIGADGVQSTVRKLAFGDAATPEYAGQGGWRWLMKGQQDIPRGMMIFGNAGMKAGFYPLPNDRMYGFITQPKERGYFDQVEGRRERVDALLGSFTAPFIRGVRSDLPESENIYYGPFAKLLIPTPWNRGRVVVIGDAAHPMPPHAASGAAMAIEDAFVLAEELSQQDDDWQSAIDRFMRRRFDRVKRVVETSVRGCDNENLAARGDYSGVRSSGPDEMKAFWDFLLEPI